MNIVTKAFPCLCIMFLCISCLHQGSNVNRLSTPENIEEIEILPVDSLKSKIIKIDKPINRIESGDIISEISYISIETNDSVLIGCYQNVIIYKDYIYIFDGLSAKAVFIFNIQGKYIKKIGDYGGAPNEFYMLSGMSIDKENNNLILFDNRKRKFFYYTLSGDYIRNEEINLRFLGKYGFLSSGEVVSSTSQNDMNIHLDKFNDYRLIYQDTLGNISKVAFKYNDNEKLYIAWSNIFYMDDELIYYPQFTNSIYTIREDKVELRYIFDLSKFDYIDNNKILTLKSDKEFDEYVSGKCYLEPYVRENRTHVSFSIKNKNERYYYLYDKESLKHIGFKSILFSEGKIIDLPTLFSNDDYFIAEIKINALCDYLAYCEKAKIMIPKDLEIIKTNLKDDDNSILALFKIKKL